MDDISATSRARLLRETKPCTIPFLLSDIAVGRNDKLGNKIAEILWLARNYAIYRSRRGVHVHFSNCQEAARSQEFKLKPCHQSNMNHWMARLRIGIGVVAGIVILIMARTILGEAIGKSLVTGNNNWEAVATVGLIAGFTERLVPSLLQRTANQWESAAGTPVQATQQQEEQKEPHQDRSTA